MATTTTLELALFHYMDKENTQTNMISLVCFITHANHIDSWLFVKGVICIIVNKTVCGGLNVALPFIYPGNGATDHELFFYSTLLIHNVLYIPVTPLFIIELFSAADGFVPVEGNKEHYSFT